MPQNQTSGIFRKAAKSPGTRWGQNTEAGEAGALRKRGGPGQRRNGKARYPAKGAEAIDGVGWDGVVMPLRGGGKSAGLGTFIKTGPAKGRHDQFMLFCVPRARPPWRRSNGIGRRHHSSMPCRAVADDLNLPPPVPTRFHNAPTEPPHSAFLGLFGIVRIDTGSGCGRRSGFR